MTHFLVIDTETTGLDPAIHGLLTLSYKHLTEFPSGERVTGKTGTLAVRFDPEKHQVSDFALQYNGINIEAHNARPDLLSDVEAGDVLRQVIEDATIRVYGNEAENIPPTVVQVIKPAPHGHNVKFDIGFAKQIVPELTSLTHHGDQDTKIIALWLKRVGLLPEDLGTGLPELAAYFGIPHNPHDSASDVDATEALDLKFIEIGRHLRALLTFSGTEPHLRHAVARQDEGTVKIGG